VELKRGLSTDLELAVRRRGGKLFFVRQIAGAGGCFCPEVPGYALNLWILENENGMREVAR